MTARRFSISSSMAIRSRIMALSAGIRTAAGLWRNWKQIAPNGKSWRKKSPSDKRLEESSDNELRRISPNCLIIPISQAAFRPGAEAYDDCRIGNLQRQRSRAGSLRRRETRGKSNLVHLAGRRFIQGNGESL